MKHFLTTRDSRDNSLGLFSEFDNFFTPFRFEDFRVLSTDIKEYPSYYLLEVEVPGVTKGNVDISVENGYLTVTMTKTDKNDGTVDSWKYLKRERNVSATRKFYIGDVSVDDIKATYNDGVLYINVPKEEKETKSLKRVEIHHPGEEIKDMI